MKDSHSTEAFLDSHFEALKAATSFDAFEVSFLIRKFQVAYHQDYLSSYLT